MEPLLAIGRQLDGSVLAANLSPDNVPSGGEQAKLALRLFLRSASDRQVERGSALRGGDGVQDSDLKQRLRRRTAPPSLSGWH